jgi:hypothetical protein
MKYGGAVKGVLRVRKSGGPEVRKAGSLVFEVICTFSLVHGRTVVGGACPMV